MRNVHKGTFGTLGIIGGAAGMVGAPLLAGRAALHAGAGKVWVGFAAADHPAVDWAQPELMLRPAARVLGAGADALVCGPGLGTDDVAADLLARAIAEPVPLVSTPTRSTLLALRPDLAAAVAARRAPTLATPHPAEAGRVLAKSVADVQADRLAAAQAIAEKLRASVVLKGAGSVLAYPDGHWDINATGNPALASAGTGDVLAGFAGAFLAQQIDPTMSLRLAVCSARRRRGRMRRGAARTGGADRRRARAGGARPSERRRGLRAINLNRCAEPSAACGLGLRTAMHRDNRVVGLAAPTRSGRIPSRFARGPLLPGSRRYSRSLAPPRRFAPGSASARAARLDGPSRRPPNALPMARIPATLRGAGPLLAVRALPWLAARAARG